MMTKVTIWLTREAEVLRICDRYRDDKVLFEGSNFLKLSREGTNVAAFPAEGKLLRAGFAFPDNTERLMRNTSLVIHEPVGNGHIILFNNEPLFRAWWHALDRLVLNGVVLGPAM